MMQPKRGRGGRHGGLCSVQRAAAAHADELHSSLSVSFFFSLFNANIDQMNNSAVVAELCIHVIFVQ